MEKNFKHIKSDTFIRTLLFKDKLWAIINLTWSTVIFWIKKRYSDTDYIVRQECVITAVEWKAYLKVDIWPPAGEYVYDIQWTKSDWTIETFLYWKFVILNEVVWTI